MMLLFNFDKSWLYLFYFTLKGNSERNNKLLEMRYTQSRLNDKHNLLSLYKLGSANKITQLRWNARQKHGLKSHQSKSWIFERAVRECGENKALIDRILPKWSCFNLTRSRIHCSVILSAIFLNTTNLEPRVLSSLSAVAVAKWRREAGEGGKC